MRGIIFGIKKDPQWGLLGYRSEHKCVTDLGVVNFTAKHFIDSVLAFTLKLGVYFRDSPADASFCQLVTVFVVDLLDTALTQEALRASRGYTCSGID